MGKSRILFVNQFFWPDIAATAQLLGDLSEDLSAGGWEVSVLTGRGSYAGGGTRERLRRRERWKGVEIYRVPSSDFGRGSSLGRILDYISFLLSAGAVVLLGSRHEIVVCLSTPPLLAVLGLVGRLRGSRFVYKVEDLYPDLAVALGKLRERTITARLLTRISACLLARADAVVALDEAMGRVLRERGAVRVRVIPNWADGKLLYPDRSLRAEARSSLGWSGRFVVLYSGNLGLAHRFDAVVEAAVHLEKREPSVRFVFAGGGPRMREVQEATLGLGNVEFMGYRPREELNYLYNAADLHLVTMREKIGGLLVPSKYTAALAVGKPVLLVGGVGSDLYEEIEEKGHGWCCDHFAAEVVGMIRKAIKSCANQGELERMSLRVRESFEEKYDRSVALASWERVLLDVINSGCS